MDNWQPIETAPKDGTVILLTDGEHLAAGMHKYRIEQDWKYRGYNEHGRIDDTFTDRIPNRDAGKRHEWWSLFGCSAFEESTNTEDWDGSIYFSPTHWMPLMPPPERADADRTEPVQNDL